MISFWEREHFLNYDYIIIGSGIVGLSTAIELKEKQANCSVLILERGLLPTGASTKNAGFACIGSLTEILADLNYMSQKNVVDLMLQRKNGLQKLRNRIGDANMDYLELGSYELISTNQEAALERLNEINTLLYPYLQGNAFTLNNSKISEFKFNSNVVKAMLVNNFEGQLNTGKMMKFLLQYAQQLGVIILNGADVTTFKDLDQNGVRVFVKHNVLNETLLFSAKKMAICTNAFAKQLLPNINVVPGRGQVLVTQPIVNLPFKGIFHFEEGYYYFRNIDNRVIFGGGRNLDFETEATTNFEYNYNILNDLQNKLQTIILPNTPFTIDMQWTGIMAFGKTKIPTLKQISKNIVIGVKLSGMGVAIGSNLGEQIANTLIDYS